MVNVGPVAIEVPPVGEAYQLIVPAEATALKFVLPEPQILPGVVLVIVGIGTTDIVSELLLAEFPILQVVEFVMTNNEITSPFDIFDVVYVNEFGAPGILRAFLCQ